MRVPNLVNAGSCSGSVSILPDARPLLRARRSQGSSLPAPIQPDTGWPSCKNTAFDTENETDASPLGEGHTPSPPSYLAFLGLRGHRGDPERGCPGMLTRGCSRPGPYGHVPGCPAAGTSRDHHGASWTPHTCSSHLLTAFVEPGLGVHTKEPRTKNMTSQQGSHELKNDSSSQQQPLQTSFCQ